MRANIDEPLIEALYGDAVQKGEWTPALVLLRTLLRAKEATISAVTLDRRSVKWSGGIVATTGSAVNGEASQRYSAHYLSIDPKAAIFAAQPAGFVVNDARHFDNSFVNHNCFYQEYSRALGLRHGLNRLIERNRAREIYLAALRSSRQGHFDCADETILVSASRHFLRAWKLREFVNETQKVATAATAALDSLGYGVAVFDDTCSVRFANAYVRAITNAGCLRLKNGRLLATSPPVQRQIEAAFMSAATMPGVAQAVRVPRGENQCWLVWCMPLSADNPLAADQLPGVLVVIRDPELASSISGRDLSVIYDLTETEAEVAHALAEGMTLNAIAENRGVKHSTVHTQLKRILQKTGLHRQSDLVRNIVSLGSLGQRGRES